MEIDHPQEESMIVNGSLLKKFVGQNVHIWLNSVGSSNNSTGVSTDKKNISVVLDSPLNQPLMGWVLVIGTPMASGTSIKCSEIIVLPSDENSEPLDEAAHNDIVHIMHNMQDFNNCGEDNSMF